MLSLYKLEVFAAVVEAGSFSKAGERLYLTQSAISQHIQDLETHLGTRLFKRGRRGVTLTPAGEILLDYTSSILGLIKEAESAVTNVEQLESGHLHIGATPGADVYLVPDWIGAFQHRFPQLTVSLTTNVTTEIVAEVLDHTLELGFVEGELAADVRLDRVVLQEVEQLVIVGRGHPWFNRRTLSITHLQGQPFIARLRNSHTRAWLEQLLHKHDIVLNIVAEFANPEAIKRAVSAGMGISILPEYVVRHELTLDLIHALPLQDVSPRRSIKLIWEGSEPFSPITKAFLAHLSSQFPLLLSFVRT